MTIKGSCFCGDVTYKIEGKLRNAASCHCSMCRKMVGAQASAYALLEPEEFSWLTGENQLTRYEPSDGYGILFCGRCGSTLGGTLNNRVSWVTLGCVEGDPQLELSMHIFTGSKAPWETIPEGVPHYEEWPPQGD